MKAKNSFGSITIGNKDWKRQSKMNHNAYINGTCNIFKKYIDEKNLSTKLYKSLLSKGTLFVPFNNFNKIMLLKKTNIIDI